MKYKILPLIIVLLFVIFVLLFRSGFQPDFIFSERNLSVSDTSRVDKILIIEKDTLRLSKDAEMLWLVNDMFMAEPVAISNFLYAFSHIDTKGKSHEISDSLPVREILMYMGKRRLDYSLVSNQNKDYLRKRGAKDYIIAGITGSPLGSFRKTTSTNPDFWRSKLLLNILPDDIKMIKVIPGSDQGKGFVLEKKGGNFSLLSLEGIPTPDSLVNMEKVLMYISYFSGIWYESVADETVDKTRNTERTYSIEIETTESKLYEFEIIPIPEDSGKVDLYRAFVQMNRRDEIFIVKYVMLDLLMQRYSHFII